MSEEQQVMLAIEYLRIWKVEVMSDVFSLVVKAWRAAREGAPSKYDAISLAHWYMEALAENMRQDTIVSISEG